MDKSNEVLQEIGDLYSKMKNNNKIGAGSVFVLPQAKFKQYLDATGNPNSSIAPAFMGVPILPSKSNSEEIIFLESQFPELPGYGSELGVDLHKILADKFRAKYQELREQLIEAFRVKGIIFQNDEAFNEFSKTQLIYQEIKGETFIIYEGQVFFKYNSAFKIKPTKTND